MYGTDPCSVVLHLSSDKSCLPGNRAELIRSLEAERIPNGLAFVTDPTAVPGTDDVLAAVVARRNALDDSLPATKARRDALLAALDEPAATSERRTALEASVNEDSPTGWNTRAARPQAAG